MAESLKDKWTILKQCLRWLKFRIYPDTTLLCLSCFTVVFVVWTGLTLPVTVAIIHGSGVHSDGKLLMQ